MGDLLHPPSALSPFPLLLSLLLLLTSGCGALKEMGRVAYVAQQLDTAALARQRGDLAEEEKALHQVIGACPNHPQANRRLIELAVLQRNRGGMEAALKRLGSEQLTFAELQALGTYYAQTGGLKKAEATYRDLLRRHPEHPESYNVLGYFYAEQGIKLDESVRLIKESLRRYARFFTLLGRLDAWQRGIALPPNSGHVVDSLGWAYFQQGKLELARRELERAVRMRPDHHEIHYHLGSVYESLKRRDDAVREYRTALRLNPTYREAEEALRRVRRET